MFILKCKSFVLFDSKTYAVVQELFCNPLIKMCLNLNGRVGQDMLAVDN